MIIVQPSHTILTPIDAPAMLRRIEAAGRTCYKSEGRANETSAEPFVKSILQRGHESVIEHESISVRFVCDRGVSHELVRHRLASFSQESTRYCNYSGDKFGSEITVVEPPFWCDHPAFDNLGNPTYDRYVLWIDACGAAENAYLALLKAGATAQEARSVLPNSLKTEIVMTANLREWRHTLRLRTSRAAHPQMRQLMIPLLKELQEKLPVVFNDIQADQ